MSTLNPSYETAEPTPGYELDMLEFTDGSKAFLADELGTTLSWQDGPLASTLEPGGDLAIVRFYYSNPVVIAEGIGVQLPGFLRRDPSGIPTATDVETAIDTNQHFVGNLGPSQSVRAPTTRSTSRSVFLLKPDIQPDPLVIGQPSTVFGEHFGPVHDVIVTANSDDVSSAQITGVDFSRNRVFGGISDQIEAARQFFPVLRDQQ